MHFIFHLLLFLASQHLSGMHHSERTSLLPLQCGGWGLFACSRVVFLLLFCLVVFSFSIFSICTRKMGKREMSCVQTPGFQYDGHCCIFRQGHSPKVDAGNNSPTSSIPGATAPLPYSLCPRCWWFPADCWPSAMVVVKTQTWVIMQYPHLKLRQSSEGHEKKFYPMPESHASNCPALCSRQNQTISFTLQATPTWGQWQKTTSIDPNLTSDCFASLASQ